MNWHKFSEEKPPKSGIYLIQYGWHPEVKIYEVISWDAKRKQFNYWDSYNDCQANMKDCRYWCEIEEPKD